MDTNEINVGNKKNTGKKWVIVALGLLLLPAFLLIVFSISSTQRCKPLMILPSADGGGTPHHIPSFAFSSQTGRVIKTEDLRGYYHVADFIFTTCPTICKDLSRNFRNLQEKSKDFPELKLVSFTVDPVTDSVPTLARYAKAQNADPNGWFFLTGPEEPIYQTIINGYKQPAYKTPLGKERVTHSPMFVLVDKDLRIRGFYNTIDPDSGEREFKRLIEEIDVLRCEYRNRDSRK